MRRSANLAFDLTDANRLTYVYQISTDTRCSTHRRYKSAAGPISLGMFTRNNDYVMSDTRSQRSCGCWNDPT